MKFTMMVLVLLMAMMMTILLPTSICAQTGTEETVRPIVETLAPTTMDPGDAACCAAAMESGTNAAVICAKAFQCRFSGAPCLQKIPGEIHRIRKFLQATLRIRKVQTPNSQLCRTTIGHPLPNWDGGAFTEALQLCGRLMRINCFA